MYDVHMCICFLVFVGTCICGFRRLTVYIFLSGFLHYMSQNLLPNPKLADLSGLANLLSLGCLLSRGLRMKVFAKTLDTYMPLAIPAILMLR